jgi:ATP/maltotriose-dependent transcriptional regulator MalT
MNDAVPRERIEYNALLDAGRNEEAAALFERLSRQLLLTGAWRDVLDLFERLPQSTHEANPRLLLVMGDAHGAGGDLQEAAAWYRQAQRSAEASADRATQGLALCQEAYLYWLRGDVQGAVALYEQAQAALTDVDEQDDAWQELRSGYPLALSSLGRLDEAEALLQAQMRIVQRTGDIDGQRMLLHNLGAMIYARRGDVENAEATLREALRLAAAGGLRVGEAAICCSLAHTLNQQAKADEALEFSLRAQAIGEAQHAPRQIARALLNQGLALLQRGDYAAAERACAQAFAHVPSNLNTNLSSDLLLLRAHIQRTNSIAQALHTAHDALAAARLQGDLWTVGLCVLFIAEVSFAMLRFDESHAALDEAFAVFAQYADQYHLVCCALLAAQLARGRGDWSALSRHTRMLMDELPRYPTFAAAAAPQVSAFLEDALRHDPTSAESLRSAVVMWGTVAPLSIALELERGGAAPPAPMTITERQREVLRLVAAGRTNTQISATLGISENTVESHLRALFAKFAVTSRTVLARRALEQGLI